MRKSSMFHLEGREYSYIFRFDLYVNLEFSTEGQGDSMSFTQAFQKHLLTKDGGFCQQLRQYVGLKQKKYLKLWVLRYD